MAVAMQEGPYIRAIVDALTNANANHSIRVDVRFTLWPILYVQKNDVVSESYVYPDSKIGVGVRCALAIARI